MTDPQPATTVRVRSEYQPGHKPAVVEKWETWANNAPDDVTALIQLAYVQALQIRVIKLVLIWTLIVLPVAIAAGLIILSQSIVAAPSPF